MSDERQDAAPVRLLAPSLEPWSPRAGAAPVAVLMSGGVDSSVTGLVLRDAGWDVVGITMVVPQAEGCTQPGICCGADAARMAAHLGIPHYFVDVRDAFRREVIDPFEHAYAGGQTPNPCVECNTRLKFGLLWDLVEAAFGIRHLATGHYARCVDGPGGPRLLQAVDRARDQSYFIFGVPRARLAHLLLPLGEWAKPEVRECAAQAKLPVANKPDSMELCFAGQGDYRQALAPAEPCPGPILDAAGRCLGQHDGIRHFTVGQRRGIGVAAGEPLYVLRLDPVRNAVIVGPRAAACRSRVRTGAPHVLQPHRLLPGAGLCGKIRSYSPPVPCRLLAASPAVLCVEFAEPQFAPTPGQYLVLYDEEGAVVGGGAIVEDEPGGV